MKDEQPTIAKTKPPAPANVRKAADPALIPTEALGPMVRRARKDAGMTLGDLAKHLNVGVVQLSDVERGLQMPGPKIRAFVDNAIALAQGTVAGGN